MSHGLAGAGGATFPCVRPDPLADKRTQAFVLGADRGYWLCRTRPQHGATRNALPFNLLMGYGNRPAAFVPGVALDVNARQPAENFRSMHSRDALAHGFRGVGRSAGDTMMVHASVRAVGARLPADRIKSTWRSRMC